MREFTMRNIRKLQNWTGAELLAYNKACSIYADKVTAFEKAERGKPHEGMPNFKSIYAEELVKANKTAKSEIPA